MEGSVWTQLFVQAAGFVSSLFASSTATPRPASPTSSPSAQGSGAASSLISRITPVGQSLLRIQRNPSMATTDALFGDMDYNGERICFTMERTAVAIPEGVYSARLELSPHFGFQTPHIDVPRRTYIEIHPANYPLQLEGCVAVGSAIDGDALDSSRSAFDRLISILPQEFTVEVASLKS
jgi:Family of unknown function (DUF5675)